MTTWRQRISLETLFTHNYFKPRNGAEKRYNAAHTKTRNTIERVFGVMKRGFPCLVHGIRMKLEKGVNIIVAVAVLHNISLEIEGINYTPEDDYRASK